MRSSVAALLGHGPAGVGAGGGGGAAGVRSPRRRGEEGVGGRCTARTSLHVPRCRYLTAHTRAPAGCPRGPDRARRSPPPLAAPAGTPAARAAAPVWRR